MKTLKKDPAKSLVRLVYALLIILILLFALPKIIPCILPFFFAWIVSLIIRPLVNLMEKAHINKRIAVIVSMLLVVSVLAGLIYWLSGIVIDEVKTVVGMFKDTKDGIPMFAWDLIESLPSSLREYAINLTEFIGKDASSVLMPALKSALPKLGGAAGKIPGAIVFLIVFVMATYFISYDGKGFKEELKKFIPREKIAYIRNIKESFFKACGGYIKAQLIIMCVVFCILLLGFAILDIELSLLLALGISIMDAIPVLGTGIALNPWAIVCLIQGNYIRAIGLFAIYGVVFLTRQFIEPKVLSAKLGIHPILTLVSMYAGLKLIGVIGMILGPLTAIIIISLLKTKQEKSKEAQTDECK
jgi:sporulation integral membrane protein YtvI